MASAIADREAPITREQLRTFHIAGRGLEQAVPEAPLRPATLDQLEQLPAFESTDLRSLYAAALESSRGNARTAFLHEVRGTVERLSQLMLLDAGGAPVSEALGSRGSALFNTSALAAALDVSANGPRRMQPERRARIEGVVAELNWALDRAREQPAFFAFDNFQRALEFCDRQLDRFTVTLRALRLGRLEIEGAFNPVLHVESLERFDWEAAEAGELLGLPAVVVFETAERLAEASLTSFGRVLRSGRPIQVVVSSAGLYAEDLGGFVPDFGYIAMAHREAFVLQSSLSRPDHLAAGLAEMAGTLRPGVAVVSVPAGPDHDARLATSLLHLSRAFPLYRYDPERDEDWAHRFELLVDEELHVTAADFAAVSRDFLQHFRVLPASAWDDEQMELSEYLKQYGRSAPLAIPYIWVTGEDGTPRRAAITRELVNLCRDRDRAWRIFAELAAPRVVAGPAAPEQAGPEHDARLEGATLAVQRVISILNSRPVSEDTSRQTCATPETCGAPEPVGDPEPARADPYIDSFLCTSCNDCFKINPRMFQYDGNKQAYIADAAAGTFAELVQAALGCPAKCIHTGAPRPGDQTVTPRLLALASKVR